MGSPQLQNMEERRAEAMNNKRRIIFSSDTALVISVALATVVLHWFTAGRYGFHRDELAVLEDARYLALGYVAYPPVTPFFARLSLEIFGTSLAGFRFFASLVNAVSLVMTGLMARELGARRVGQLLAVVAALPVCLALGAVMQYVSFDYLFWVLTAYFVLRLLKSDDPRWWVAIGAAIGLGMMTKYTMGFLALGIVIGVLLTNARCHFKSKWLWLGVAVSLLVFLPNFIWQAQNHFISLDFLRNIHARDVRIGRTKGFLPDQLKYTLLAMPLWLAGLYFYLISRDGKRYRMLGWMYVVPLVLFVVAKGRGYYLLPAYPMLYAAGSAWAERWLAGMRRGWVNAVRAVLWAALVVDAVFFAAIALPMTPVGSAWWKMASAVNGNLREEIGWPELVQTIASVRDSLPAQDRGRLGILTGNYGEAGAVNLYGPQHGLPHAISGINSFWQRGYGDPPPQTLIVVGLSQKFLDRNFESCAVAARIWTPDGVENEETGRPDVFVCRGLKQSWPDFWKDFRYYG